MCWIRVTLFQKSYHFLNLVLSPRSKSGGPKRTSQPGQEYGRKKKAKKIISKVRILPYENAYFFTFLKIWKTGNFDRGISPWKRCLQKKRSIPRRRQRKMQENCHLRFLIFELSSQRFFDLKFAIFRFFKNSKKRKFWRFWLPNCGHFLNT